MKTWKSILTLAIASLATATISAQTVIEKKPAGQQQPVDASAVKNPAMAPMMIPLTGVTTTNASKVQDAIKAIIHPHYKCEKCTYTSKEPGTCPTCKTTLVTDKAASAPVAKAVTIDATKSTLSIALAPQQWVKLSEIESASAAEGVKLARDQIQIPSFSRLIITADATAAPKIQAALTEAKLFSKVVATYDEKSKAVRVDTETANPLPTYAAVSAAISKAGEFKLSDVVWAAPCDACAKAGMIQAACKACASKMS